MTCDMPTYQGIPDKEQTFSVAFLEDTTLVSMPVASLRLLSEADWLTQLEGLAPTVVDFPLSDGMAKTGVIFNLTLKNGCLRQFEYVLGRSGNPYAYHPISFHAKLRQVVLPTATILYTANEVAST